VVREIRHDNHLLAMIISGSPREHGVHFVTPRELAIQVGLMRHPSGRKIQPHVHNPVPRALEYTQEVLLIRRGRLRVDFYSPGKDYLQSEVVEAGDILVLATGGHGFEALEELEMVEVKNGPYAGDADKTRFESGR
jgi:hypothetical protein